MFWKILRPHYWILDRKVRSTNRFLIFGVLAALILGGQWIYNNWIAPNLAHLNSGQFMLIISSLLPLSIFILLLFTMLGVGDITHNLFQAFDIELLLTAPVSYRTIFLVKLLQSSRATVIPALGFASLFVLLGIAREAMPLYYLLMTILILSVMLLVTTLVMLTVLLLTRLLPSEKIRSWVPVITGLITVILVLFQQPATQWILSQQELMTALTESIFETNRLAALSGLSAGAAALASLFTYQIFNRSFHEGWNRYQVVPVIGTVAVEDTARPLRGAARWMRPLPVPLRSFLVKDWLEIRRDPRGLLNLAQPLVFIIIIVAPFLSNNEWRTTLQPILFWFILIYLGFFLSIVPVGIPLLGLAQEGANISLLRSAPISMSQVLKGKFWASWSPMVTAWMIVFLATGLLLRFPMWQVGFILGIIFYGLVGATVASLAIGAIKIDFSHKDLKHRTAGLASYLIMGVNGVFILLVILFGILLMIRMLPTSSTVAAIRSLSDFRVVGWLFTETYIPLLVLLGCQVVYWIGIRYLWSAGVRRLEHLEIG